MLACNAEDATRRKSLAERAVGAVERTDQVEFCTVADIEGQSTSDLILRSRREPEEAVDVEWPHADPWPKITAATRSAASLCIGGVTCV